MRSTIAIAVRHRSNSSFCCALKASSDLAKLQIMLDGITHSSAAWRERGRVSQPLTRRVKSVMPPTSTWTYVDNVFDENVRLWPRADMRQCTHAAVKPRCAQIPHVSNDMIDGTSELLSSKQQLQSSPLNWHDSECPRVKSQTETRTTGLCASHRVTSFVPSQA